MNTIQSNDDVMAVASVMGKIAMFVQEMDTFADDKNLSRTNKMKKALNHITKARNLLVDELVEDGFVFSKLLRGAKFRALMIDEEELT